MSSETRRAYQTYALSNTLYSNFYCTGTAVPDTGHPYLQQDLFIESREALSRANTGIGYLDRGWTVQAQVGNKFLVKRQGLYALVGPQDMQYPGDSCPEYGAKIAVRGPSENRRLVPGFYMAFGDAGLPSTGPSMRVRVYLNIVPDTAACLLGALTKAMNEGSIPFIVKILNGRSAKIRCDNFVLFVSLRAYAKTIALLARVISDHRIRLRPLVPVFAKPLDDGIAAAIDPADGGSFGLSRCQVMAEGLINAWESGDQSQENKWRCLADAFTARGLILGRPYLDVDGVELIEDFGADARPTIRSAHASYQTTQRECCLYVAGEIAEHLEATAFRADQRCNWLSPDAEPGRISNRIGTSYRTLGGDLYGGTSGIALFLSALCYVGGERDRHFDTAIAAARHALDRLDDRARPVHEGFYTGRTGILVASMLCAQFLRSGDLYDQTVLALKDDGDAVDFSTPHDLLAGRAGAILGRLILAEFTQTTLRQKLLDQAVLMGEALLDGSTRQPTGLAWITDSRLARQPLTGISHGASGIGLALLELYVATGDDRFRKAACLAIDYENSCYSSQQENWLDFRSEARTDPDTDATAMHWCHGAPGIGIARIRFFDVLDQYGDDLRVAGHRTLRSLEEAVADGRANFSLCHGLLGNAECLTLMASDSSDFQREAKMVARRAGALGIDRHRDNPLSWDCGGTQLSPNFMLGLAGIGYFYLRLACARLPSVLLPSPAEIVPDWPAADDQCHAASSD